MNIRYIIILASISFLSHIIWENAQAPLYAGYQSFLQHLSPCSIGAFGDVVITFFVLGLVRLLKKDIPQTTSDFLALAIIGFAVAVFIEQNALWSGKWNYAPTMPLIPYLQVGLTPILQMTLLLPFSFSLVHWLNQKSYAKI